MIIAHSARSFKVPLRVGIDGFMLTHGKQVKRVSFLLRALKTFPAVGLRVIGKVSFSVISGYLLTFIDVKYQIK